MQHDDDEVDELNFETDYQHENLIQYLFEHDDADDVGIEQDVIDAHHQ